PSRTVRTGRVWGGRALPWVVIRIVFADVEPPLGELWPEGATSFPPPLAGEGQGGGMQYDRAFQVTPSPPLQPKSDVSDFGQSIEGPNSGKPEFGCKRGREQTEHVARVDCTSPE